MANKTVDNGTQNVVNNDGAVEAVAEQQQPMQPQVTQPAAVVTAEPPKQPNWFKRNWKKVAAGAAAVTAAVGSAFVAYNKGKQAGAASYYPPQNDGEDYSLNPNIE